MSGISCRRFESLLLIFAPSCCEVWSLSGCEFFRLILLQYCDVRFSIWYFPESYQMLSGSVCLGFIHVNQTLSIRLIFVGLVVERCSASTLCHVCGVCLGWKSQQ